ncbi:anti-sigma factor [Microbacterium sp. AZCO]|uniref:anti-sigma factor n=1 Tax=Microbacterium sp. AZCO TaxID=3142976 RepID=UPI0031F44FAB
MNVHEFAELAAGHALGALTIYDERAFQEALAQHPEWAGILDADAATVAELAESVAEVEPPARVRAALLAQISGADRHAVEVTADVADAIPDASPLVAPPLEDPALEPLEDPAPEPFGAAAEPATVRDVVEPPTSTEAIQTAARRTWTRGLLALAASFVLLIAIGTGVAYLGDRLREPADVRALNQIEAAADSQSATVQVEGGGTATAHWSPSSGKAVLVTDGLDEAGAKQTYELWFVRGGTPVSAGVFDTDRAGDATTLLDGSMQAGDTIAVTVEPAGGSPTGQPSSDPILTIPTA